MDHIEIRTSRTIIRAFQATDAGDVFGGITPVIARFLSCEKPLSSETFAEVWQSWLSLMDEGADLYFVIRLTTNGSYLGILYLRGIRTPYAELGIWLEEEVHGRGFGKETVSAVATWATQALKTRYVEFCVDERDIRGRIIAESLAGCIIGRRSNGNCSSVVYRLPIDGSRTIPESEEASI
jgi:RimJ/RimL family protein N-acetyltransferase